MVKYESDPVVIELLVKIADTSGNIELDCEELKARLDDIRTFNEKEEKNKRILAQFDEDEEKRIDKLMKLYIETDGKMKRFQLAWFGSKYNFGKYLDALSFEIKTLISDKFQYLIKTKDYNDINPRIEFFKLKKELDAKFRIPKKKLYELKK